jgi:hypothetical protein
MSRTGPHGYDKGPSPFGVQFRRSSAPRSRPNKYATLLPSSQRQTAGQRRQQRRQWPRTS